MVGTRELRTIALGIGITLMGAGERMGPSALFAEVHDSQSAARRLETGPEAKPSRLRSMADKLPLYFVENKGQVDARVAYYVQGKDQIIYFTADGLTLVLTDKPRQKAQFASLGAGVATAERSEHSLHPLAARRLAVKLDFVGADSQVKPAGEKPTPALINYFVGPESEWKTGLRTYRRLAYRDLWPGIDLVYSGTVQRLKYMFVVHPGADPGRIKLRYRGADAVSVNERGQLQVQTELGEFQDDKPYAYQEVDGGSADVTVGYDLQPRADSAADQYGFNLGSYDPALPLIIDPTLLVYAGFIGGTGDDRGNAIAVDGQKNAYITGETNSAQISFPDGNGFGPIPGVDQTQNGGVDAFVAKVNAEGTDLIYASFIGGSGDDLGRGIALRPGESGCPPACSVYIVGETNSSQTSFPTIIGPDLTHNVGVDAFVVKLNATGTALVYAGYVGGSGDDLGLGIVVDSAGNAYITGATNSVQTSFPDGNGFGPIPGFDQTLNGGVDAFVARVKADGSGLDYAGYVGGLENDRGNGIALQPGETGCPPDCSVYIVGETSSDRTTFLDANGFGAVPGFDHTQNGGVDAFVVKVKADASGLDYATYVGGSLDDLGLGIAVDSAGNAYITGATNSTETTFPDGNGFGAVTGFDHTQNGGIDAFVAKLNAAGTALLYAAYMGGLGDDGGNAIAVDGAGNAYITGETNSTQISFPDGNGFGDLFGVDQTSNGGVDAFVAKICAVCADLKVTISDSPDPVRVGDDVTYTITVKNNGPDAATNVIVTDTLPDTVTFVPALSSGSCVEIVLHTVECALGAVSSGSSPTFIIVATTTVKGKLVNTVSVSADQADPNISNDTATAHTVVTLSNLVVKKLQAPAAAMPGDVITIDDVTANSGAIAAEASTTRFYLSADRSDDPSEELNNSRGVPALEPKEPNPGSTTVTIPLATVLGKYFLIAVPDADNVVEETQENNKRKRRIQITLPDLTVTVLKAPGTAAAGSSVVVQDTTSNKAPVPAGASTTRFYLSTDGLFDVGDVFLDSRPVPALAAKAKSAGSTTVTMPLGPAPGVYFVLAVADGDGAVSETPEGEGNNVRSRKITITPP